MAIKDLLDQVKQNPTTVAVSLFACLVVGSIGAMFYLKVAEARIALLDERMKTQEYEAKKQKHINRIVQDQVGSLRIGFDGLPSAVTGVRLQLADLNLPRFVSTKQREKLDESLKIVENQIVQLQAAISNTEALSKTLDSLVTGAIAEEEGRFAEAAKFYAIAANQGVPEAQTKLARLYLNGTGVAKDTQIAARLLEVAALRGSTAAKDDAIMLYFAGHGTQDPTVRAAALLSLEPHSATQLLTLRDLIQKLDETKRSDLKHAIEQLRRTQAGLAKQEGPIENR